MKTYPLTRTNVAIVETAEEYGWELVWRNPTQEEETANAWDEITPSDNENPIYGVFAIVNGEQAILWERWALFHTTPYLSEVVRSSTRSENNQEEE